MNISVFGLGYVGCVSAACLADLGHKVIGVDVARDKVDMINAGKSTIVEDQIGDIVKKTVTEGRLRATDNTDEAISETEISLVCVGTPSNENGSLNLDYVRSCCAAIGQTLKDKSDYHVVVMRSTMLPGSIRSTVIPALETQSGKRVGAGVGVCINPEFLREASSVWDFHHPPYTVIGAYDQKSGDTLARMYDDIEAPVMTVPIEAAEMIKYASNSYHALKICFANEMGRLAKKAGLDSHILMDLFCKDDKLNTSGAYLKPGFAFGGSCLPKDVRAITYFARSVDQEVPVLASLIQSNQAHLDHAVQMVMREGRRNVGVIGLAFKAGTDDLRESPLVSLVEQLVGKGYPLKIYDEHVELSRIFGANRSYIEKEIPHLEKLMTSDLKALVDFSDVIVVGQGNVDFKGLNLAGKEVVELTRPKTAIEAGKNHGIAW